MAEMTGIGWAHSTFNPWLGCRKISPGCDRCYAEVWSRRSPHSTKGLWSGTRVRTTAETWKHPVRWNKKALASGRRPRVFCASLADVFDNEIPDESWRADLWELIKATPALRWMLLTKRIGNAEKMLPPDWPYPNAGLMATIVNQEEWDRDYAKLARLPATWRGVSVEPMLEPIDIGNAKPDWIICGGESGAGHRHCDTNWVRHMRAQCDRNGIAFFFKQWGGRFADSEGCKLDGQEYKEFPPALA